MSPLNYPDSGWQRASKDAPFLVAARGGEPSRRPAWMMRQAGRYLPEYRDLRSTMSFLELCNTSDAACEVTLQPLRRFDLDAAILFTDLLVPVVPMGFGLEYNPGPVLQRTVASDADVDALKIPDPETDIAPMLATARKVRTALPADKAVLGFVGAPFTMACYLTEGSGSKDWSKTRRMMHAEPERFERLLARIGDCLEPLARALVDNGCDGIQVFDSWASVLCHESYKRFAAPSSERLIEAIKDAGAVAVSYVNGAYQHLDSMRRSCADVLAVDWRHDLGSFRGRLGPDRALQGNLDPTALFCRSDDLTQRVGELCSGAGRSGHIFNLGHGVLPQTDPDSLHVALEAARKDL